MHERLVQVGTAAKSFLAGAQVFFSFTRTPVSEPTARRYTERAGAVMEECESEQFPVEPEDPEDRRPRWTGADGVFIRLVGGGWREVRTVSIGAVETTLLADGQLEVRTTDLSYFSRLTDSAETFLKLAGVECRRRRLAEALAGGSRVGWRRLVPAVVRPVLSERPALAGLLPRRRAGPHLQQGPLAGRRLG